MTSARQPPRQPVPDLQGKERDAKDGKDAKGENDRERTKEPSHDTGFRILEKSLKRVLGHSRTACLSCASHPVAYIQLDAP